MKTYILLNPYGCPVSGSIQKRKRKPANGNWVEIEKSIPLLAITTFQNTYTPGFPVGVWNVNKNYLGIANNAIEYATIWNSDPANAELGQLSPTDVNATSFYFIGSGNPTLYGLRFYKFDITNVVAVFGSEQTFVDWGDGTATFCNQKVTASDIAGQYYGQTRTKYAGFRANKNFGTATSTVTVFHNEIDKVSGVVDTTYTGLGDGRGLSNLRGNFPSKTKQIMIGVGDAKAKNVNMANVNWSELKDVESLIFFSWTGNSVDTSVLPGFTHMKKLERFWCYYNNTSVSTYQLLNGTYFPNMRVIDITFTSVSTSPIGDLSNVISNPESIRIQNMSQADQDALWIAFAAKLSTPKFSQRTLSFGTGTVASAEARATLIARGWFVS